MDVEVLLTSTMLFSYTAKNLSGKSKNCSLEALMAMFSIEANFENL